MKIFKLSLSCIAMLLFATTEAYSAGQWLPDTDYGIDGTSGTGPSGRGQGGQDDPNGWRKTCEQLGYRAENPNPDTVDCDEVSGGQLWNDKLGDDICYKNCRCKADFNLTCDVLAAKGMYCRKANVYCDIEGERKFSKTASECHPVCCNSTEEYTEGCEKRVVVDEFEGAGYTPVYGTADVIACDVGGSEYIDKQTNEKTEGCSNVSCQRCMDDTCPDGYKHKSKVNVDESEIKISQHPDRDECVKIISGECGHDGDCEEGEICVKDDKGVGYCQVPCDEKEDCKADEICQEVTDYENQKHMICRACGEGEKICGDKCISTTECCYNGKEGCDGNPIGNMCLTGEQSAECGCQSNEHCQEGYACKNGECVDDTCPEGDVDDPNKCGSNSIARYNITTDSDKQCYSCITCATDYKVVSEKAYNDGTACSTLYAVADGYQHGDSGVCVKCYDCEQDSDCPDGETPGDRYCNRTTGKCVPKCEASQKYCNKTGKCIGSNDVCCYEDETVCNGKCINRANGGCCDDSDCADGEMCSRTENKCVFDKCPDDFTSGSVCENGIPPLTTQVGNYTCYKCETCEELGMKDCNGKCIASNECCGDCKTGEVCKEGKCLNDTCDTGYDKTKVGRCLNGLGPLTETTEAGTTCFKCPSCEENGMKDCFGTCVSMDTCCAQCSSGTVCYEDACYDDTCPEGYEEDLNAVLRDCELKGDVISTTTASGKRCAKCVSCSSKGQIYCEGSCVSKETCCTWGLPDYEYGLYGCHNGQKCNTSTGTCYTPSSSNQSPTTQSDGCPDTDPERIAWCKARGYENKQMNCEEAEKCKCFGEYLKCIKW